MLCSFVVCVQQRELSATAQFDAVAAVAALGGTCTHADPTSPSVTHAVLGGSTFFEHSRPARAAKRQGKVMFTLEAFKVRTLARGYLYCC